MKKCQKCEADKELKFFSKDKRSPDGKMRRCKQCMSSDYKKWYKDNPEKIAVLREKDKEYRKEYYSDPKRREQYRIWYIIREYNLSEEDYLKLLEKQNNKCKICNKPEKSGRNLAIDHCHKTNKIRGLLCNQCNRALGYLKEDINLFEAAIKYLKEHI
jgi:hypothetical protein